jgi:hypothetical protein
VVVVVGRVVVVERAFANVVVVVDAVFLVEVVVVESALDVVVVPFTTGVVVVVTGVVVVVEGELTRAIVGVALLAMKPTISPDATPEPTRTDWVRCRTRAKR